MNIYFKSLKWCINCFLQTSHVTGVDVLTWCAGVRDSSSGSSVLPTQHGGAGQVSGSELEYLCLYVFVYLWICVFVTFCICVFVSLCICVYVSLFICVFVTFCISVFVSLCICVFVRCVRQILTLEEGGQKRGGRGASLQSGKSQCPNTANNWLLSNPFVAAAILSTAMPFPSSGDEISNAEYWDLLSVCKNAYFCL